MGGRNREIIKSMLGAGGGRGWMDDLVRRTYFSIGAGSDEQDHASAQRMLRAGVGPARRPEGQAGARPTTGPM